MQLLKPDTGSATEAAPSIKLHVDGLSRVYGDFVALHPTQLEVRTGELLTLLGPSGSGKTTMLQLISGLVEASSGRLLIDGQDRTSTPVHKRDIGVVFQSYALFPHLTVRENVAFPLQMRGLSAREIGAKVDAALEMVGLGHAGGRSSSALSGGQQQRVALARCLVYSPSVILMDEPLGALDRKLRESMQIEIKRIHRDTGATIIFVTHDQEEALALSDRVCLMNQGRIAQIGTPREVYERPNSAFVADFIGISNLIRGRVAGQWLETADGRVPAPAGAIGNALIAIRPEFMALDATNGWKLDGTVAESIYVGSESRVIVQMASGARLTVRQRPGDRARQVGESVSINWAPEHMLLLPDEPPSA